MFPEYSELISQLKASDDRFMQLCEKHNVLHEKIQSMVTHAALGTQEEIETLKKEKLLIKDQVYATLMKHSGTVRA